jgi:hypothetical protein
MKMIVRQGKEIKCQVRFLIQQTKISSEGIYIVDWISSSMSEKFTGAVTKLGTLLAKLTIAFATRPGKQL